MSNKTYHIEQVDQLLNEVENLIHQGHVRDEAENGIVCNYKKFALVVKDSEGEIVGALQAYTAFSEIYIDDIWVSPSARKNGLGRKLLHELENQFNGQGYNNINLVTSHFQAPDFYKKCGFIAEFTRVNKKNPKLSKTFFVKYFDEENQFQGVYKKNATKKISIRTANETDQNFLYDMLQQAIFSTDASHQENNSHNSPNIKKYVADWGKKEGDFGLIAIDNNLKIGAIWLRFFNAQNPGYGYINDNIPEIGIAVDSKYRSKGIGTALLKKLIQELPQTIKTISLSVHPHNQAVQLYRKLGFIEYGKSGDSIVMKYDRII